ncbi:MAG TPA: transglutaminase family protein [Planctomycetota bacterium]|nr:transglutaminase family protein [Planctomycetota bacterium]
MHPLFRATALASLILAAACSSRRGETTAVPAGAARVDAVRSVTVADAPAVRRFRFDYTTTVNEIPAGARELTVWIPRPRAEGEVQEVVSARIDAPPGASVVEGSDARGDNRFWCVTVPNPAAPVKITTRSEVVRREQMNNDFRKAGAGKPTPEQQEQVARWLGADAMVPNEGKPAQLAATVARGETNHVNVARALYDDVLSRMRYSKDGEGWGRGDTNWACESGFGNCTDFHSMFMSFGRSRGIPVRFFMGFPLPETRGKGEVKGYHCWAEFFSPDLGWVPVDISEADKDPSMAQYYFGALTEDRISFTLGRDLELTPSPASGRLNFFIYPVAEVDGKSVKADRAFAYEDV